MCASVTGVQTCALAISVALIWALAAVALVILTGWGGHISLGQFAIVGIGALAGGNLIQRYNLDFFFVLVVSGAAGAVVSLVVGLPALRIKGLFLAVTTLALAVALDQYVLNFNNFPDLIPTQVGRPMLLERFDLTDGRTMYRSEEHTSELQSLMRTSYAVFCLKKKIPPHVT